MLLGTLSACACYVCSVNTQETGLWSLKARLTQNPDLRFPAYEYIAAFCCWVLPAGTPCCVTGGVFSEPTSGSCFQSRLRTGLQLSIFFRGFKVQTHFLESRAISWPVAREFHEDLKRRNLRQDKLQTHPAPKLRRMRRKPSTAGKIGLFELTFCFQL